LQAVENEVSRRNPPIEPFLIFGIALLQLKRFCLVFWPPQEMRNVRKPPCTMKAAFANRFVPGIASA
jgi:hypothetical protein